MAEAVPIDMAPVRARAVSVFVMADFIFNNPVVVSESKKPFVVGCPLHHQRAVAKNYRYVEGSESKGRIR
jgi:hypothetical protein